MVRTRFKDFDIAIKDDSIYIKKNDKIFTLVDNRITYHDDILFASTATLLNHWVTWNNSDEIKFSISVKNNKYDGIINGNEFSYIYNGEFEILSKPEDILKSYGKSKLSKIKYKLFWFEKDFNKRHKRIDLVYSKFDPTLMNFQKYLSDEDYEYMISNEYDIARNEKIFNKLISSENKIETKKEIIVSNIITKEELEEEKASETLDKIVEEIFSEMYPNEDINDYYEIFEINEMLEPLVTIKDIEKFKVIVKKELIRIKEREKKKKENIDNELEKINSDVKYYYKSLQDMFSDFPEFIDKCKHKYNHSKDLLIQKRINEFELIYSNVLKIIEKY